MLNNPVGWFEIYVQDMKKAKSFYENVFQVKLEPMCSEEIEMWIFPFQKDKQGAHGAIAKMQGVPSGGNSTLVYFSCADCAEEAARVEGNGGKVFREKMSIGQFGFISLVFDTDNNMIGLHSWK